MVHMRVLILRSYISKYNIFIRLYGYAARELLRRNECLKAPTELAMGHGLDHSFGLSEWSSPSHGSFFSSYPRCLSTIVEVWRTIDTCILQMAANTTQEHPQRQQEDCESSLEPFFFFLEATYTDCITRRPMPPRLTVSSPKILI